MSIVRENLMTREGYAPYCGDMNCKAGMPRTRFVNGQFQCACGWRSGFEAEFIDAYQAKWAKPSEALPSPTDAPRSWTASRLRSHQPTGFVRVTEI